jgi:hypothetical protein
VKKKKKKDGSREVEREGGVGVKEGGKEREIGSVRLPARE